MQKAFPFIFAAALAFTGNSVAAQVDTSRETFDIIIDPDISLPDAIKIEVEPLLEPPVIKTPRFTYSFPTKQYEVPSVFKPAPAVSIQTFPQNRIYSNYVRLGFGNYVTPLAEIYLHNLRSSNTAYGFNAKHISQLDKPDTRFSETSAQLHGIRYYEQGTFGAMANYSRNRYNLYGYNHDQYDIDEDSVKQVFQNVDVRTSFRKNVKRETQFKWGFDIGYYNFSANNKVKENDFEIKANGSGKVGKNMLNAEISFNYNSIGDTSLYKRTFFHITPRYVIDRKNYHVEIGLNYTQANDTIKNRFYLYPVLQGTYQLIPGKLTAFLGLTGNVIKNTLRGYANENPFIDPGLEIRNGFNNIDFSAGVRGQITSRAGFVVQFSQRKISNLHYYLSDTTPTGKFIALYEDETALMNFKAELNIAVNDKIRLASVLNFYNYSLSDEKRPWQRQNIDFKLNFSYNLGNKVYAFAEAYVIGKRYARVAYLPFNETELKPITDLNVGVEYRYTKKVSAFIRVNNLTSVRYQRWYNYKVYGINGLLGVTFTL